MNRRQVMLISIFIGLTTIFSLKSYAQIISGAFVADSGGNGLSIGPETQHRNPPVSNNNKRFSNNSVLRIAANRGWASLGFVINDREVGAQDGGMLVIAHQSPSSSIYRYPCRGGGSLTIGWQPAGRSQMCREGLDIGERQNKREFAFLRDSLSKALEPIPVRGVNDLENSDTIMLGQNEEFSTEDLAVKVGQGQTVIRRYSIPFTIYYYNCDIDRNPACRTNQNLIRVEEMETVKIDVVLGDIAVETQSDSSDVPVRQGQSYIHGAGVENISDLDGAINSCEVQQFLNLAYWPSNNIPSEAVDGVISQIRQHREALSFIFGRPGSLSELEQGVVDEMNLARQNPEFYIQFLEERKARYEGDILILPDGRRIRTNGGVDVVEEAIQFLRSVEPVPPLSVSQGMSQASKDHVRDTGPLGIMSHDGNDGSTISDRLNRYGSWGCKIAENINYGSSTARDVVLDLIIDDYDPNRSHRKSIFDRDLQVTGVGCGSHSESGAMCVIKYAGGYIDN